MHAQKELDTRGLNCPLPILKAKKALADMARPWRSRWTLSGGAIGSRAMSCNRWRYFWS